MNIQMAALEIIGLKSDLHRFLTVLRELGCVHIDSVLDSPEVLARPLTLDAETLHRQEELSIMAARVEGLLEILGVPENGQITPLPVQKTEVSTEVAIQQTLDQLRPQVQVLVSRRDELTRELTSLPLYETTLRKLIPLVPASAHDPGNALIGVLVNRANVAVLDLVGNEILNRTQGTASVISSDVDDSTRAMLIVLQKRHVAEVEILLGQKDVSRLHLPPELGEGLPAAMLETVHHRLSEIPEEQRQVQNSLARFSAQWSLSLSSWKLWLQEELEGYQVLSRFGETDATFILVGWVPKKDLVKVTDTLREKIGETVFVQELPIKPEIRSKIPVILTNPPSARPFESLVRMLELPRYNRIDPTQMMSFFLPVFFGLMLADIGYGLIILAASLVLIRKFRTGFLHDILIVIAIGSGWAILFGVLFGEVFGNLGAVFGLRPIWIARDSAEDVFGFLIMSVAIGAGHVSLGLILGLFEAFRDRSRVQMLERGGMLVGLISLFLLVGVLTKSLPDGFMTPAVAGVIVGIVLLSTSLGWLGILMGPIEFIGLIGNVLSYLRIAAIGLASVYLAKVANTMAGMVGNIVVGLILAILIHALNLVLGVFSPTIHSLRLHYVEFFRKFYEGGGRPYEPFRSHHI